MGEEVWAEQANEENVIFEAKILEVRDISLSKKNSKTRKSKKEEKSYEYLVHYFGWNKKWDEWLTKDRLHKLDSITVKKKSARTSGTGVKVKKRKRGKSTITVIDEEKIGDDSKSSTKAKNDADSKTNTNKKKKQKKKQSAQDKSSAFTTQSIVQPTYADSQMEDTDTSPAIKLSLTFKLKKQLIRDWELVAKQHLVPLPRTPNVATIVQGFLAFKKKGKRYDKSIQVICDGICKYFDVAVSRQLLYRFERPQYRRMIVKGQRVASKPSEIYGAEHLLRLFVKLPSMLAQTTMDAEATAQVQTRLGDFLKYLQKHHSSLFLTDYDKASDTYIKQYRQLWNC